LSPAPPIHDEIALARAVGRLRSRLDPLDAERASLRTPIIHYLVREGRKALDISTPEKAFGLLQQALGLFSPEEIAAGVRNDELANFAWTVRQPFARRGSEPEVLITLRLLESLWPDRPRVVRERQAFEAWIFDAYQGSRGPAAQLGRLIDLYEEVAKRWPSPQVLGHLESLYGRRDAVERAAKDQQRKDSFDLGLFSRRPGFAVYELSRLYLRRGDTQGAARAIGRHARESEGGVALHALVVKAAGFPKDIDSHLALARVFESRDREVSLRICTDLARRVTNDARPLGCAAKELALLSSPEGAILLFEQAIQLAPRERTLAEALIRLYENRVLELVSAEKLADARQALDALVRFAETAKSRIEGFDPPSLAGVTFAVGQGHLNGGDIRRSVVYFERSIGYRPSARVFTELGKIRTNTGDAQGAINVYRRGLQLKHENPVEAAFARAKLLTRIADSQSQLGQEKDAEKTRKEALTLWDKLLGEGLNAAGEVEAHIERGRILYHLGQAAKSVEELAKAIDSDAERGDTYAQVIAFLTTRGQLSAALDVYRRALGRPEVSTYLRTYSSLWIVDLQQRRQDTSDVSAVEYLRALRGDEWHNELARYALKRVSYEQLLARADTVGKRAEAYFYESMRRYAAGRKGEARDLWQQVIKTDMMGFFEYEMASYFLRKGPDTPEAPGLVPPGRRGKGPARRPVPTRPGARARRPQ
jgi:tetratricopeptide (TPR) repeat protein